MDQESVSSPPVPPQAKQPTLQFHRPDKKKVILLSAGITVVLIAAVFLLLTGGILPAKKQTAQPVITTVPTPSPTAIPLETEYANPFDEKEAFENPFAEETGETYTNPFGQ